jgi:hypothetical protein
MSEQKYTKNSQAIKALTDDFSKEVIHYWRELLNIAIENYITRCPAEYRTIYDACVDEFGKNRIHGLLERAVEKAYQVTAFPVIQPANSPAEKSIKYHDICTIDEMAKRLKAENMGTFTKNAIRTFVINGQIPSVKAGSKYLVSYKNMLAFIEEGNHESPQAYAGKIRPVKP